MKGPIIFAALLAAVVFFAPTDSAAQQSPATIAAAANAPNIEGWTARAHQVPQNLMRPDAPVPKIEARGDAPSTIGAERPGVAEVKKKDGGNTQLMIDDDAFLLAVWHRGFWAMPPGGFTRFLWQPPVPINPESTLASGSAMGCAAP